jgi:hypothetical protein
MDGGVDPSAGDTAWTEPDHHLPAVAAAGYYITPGARPDASRPHWTLARLPAPSWRDTLITEGDIHWMTAGAVLSIY